MLTNVKILPGEYWWGGTTITKLCPITETSEYHQDFRVTCENQTAPCFVSSMGRYIWSDAPFKVDASAGNIALEGEEVELIKAGDTLRDAYLAVSKKHFPSDGRKLNDLFFKVAQYCTWIECAYWPTQEKVLNYAHAIIEHGLEPGIFIIDEGWAPQMAYGLWDFDPARFSDPKAMIDELHRLGFTVMLWVVPFVVPNGPEYVMTTTTATGRDKEAAAHTFLRTKDGQVAVTRWWDGYSAILDFTNPYDVEYMKKQLDRLMTDYGVDGFKFDGGATVHYANHSLCFGERGTDKTEYDLNVAWNEFGTSYEFHEFKDTYTFGGRNLIARLHDRNQSWHGMGIDDIIPCALVAGLIGHPFICPDMIGGGQWLDRYNPAFRCNEELFVRMAQCGVLYPMIQYSWAPWEALSEENMKACLDVARIHKLMSDEMLRLVREAEQTGEPILRLLEYNDPHQGYQDIDDEYMVGEDILVAPVVTEGTVARPVTFPQGTWQDEEGNLYEGRNTLMMDAPLDKVLWFTRVK